MRRFLLVASFVVSMALQAYGQAVEPEVLVVFTLDKSSEPSSDHSIKWAETETFSGPSISFTLNEQETKFSIGDQGYKRIITFTPASATPIAISELYDYGILITYTSEDELLMRGNKMFRRIDTTLNQLVETYNYPEIVISNQCFKALSASNPSVYFRCNNGKYFSYDPVTHVVSEITKSDIYPREGIDKEDYFVVHLNPTTQVTINLNYRRHGDVIGYDANNNIYVYAMFDGKWYISKWNSVGSLVGKFEQPLPNVIERCYEDSIICEYDRLLYTLSMTVGALGNLYALQWYDKDKIRIVRYPSSAFQP